MKSNSMTESYPLLDKSIFGAIFGRIHLRIRFTTDLLSFLKNSVAHDRPVSLVWEKRSDIHIESIVYY